MSRGRNWIVGAVVTGAALGLAALVAKRLFQPDSSADRPVAGAFAAPVEVAAVEHGPIRARRVFSGSLDATARITVAPKVSGRIESLPVDLADEVQKGQLVARLDDDEHVQAVAQAEAELAVVRAGLMEAENAAVIAKRELERVRTLRERGVASESQLDTVRADNLAKNAAVEVAKAQVTRGEAQLEAARIRLGYTKIHADWEGADTRRVVAQRFAEEGDTVSANTPLLSIIQLNPIEAVIFATERDYALLAPGQTVSITTDAHPRRTWTGSVARISPVFREGSRQARVEVLAANDDDALKPGMFVRVEAVLGSEQDATIVPVQALAERDGRPVLFVIGTNERGETVARLTPVEIGIREGERVQVVGEGVEGRVVTLGQQLLGDDSPVSIPGDAVQRAQGRGDQ